MNKVAIFAFNGDPICFIHVLLNALDMEAKGYDVRIIMEGAATGIIPELVKDGHPLKSLYLQVKQKKLISAVCKACSMKMNTFTAAESEGLPIVDDMSGHPSMSSYLHSGYQIITF